MSDHPKRLYRSYTNRVFAGVCGGLGEYFGIDPTIVRILWVLLVLAGGSGILIYLIAIFVIPRRPIVLSTAAPEPAPPSSSSAGKVFGIVIVAFGILLLLDNLDIICFDTWWHRSWEFMLPALLIGAGLYVIMRKKEVPSQPAAPEGADAAQGPTAAGTTSVPPPAPSHPHRLYRSRKDRKILGVCGGFAEYLEVDPVIVRVLYAAFVVMSVGAGIILYLLVSLIVPEEPVQYNQGM